MTNLRKSAINITIVTISFVLCLGAAEFIIRFLPIDRTTISQLVGLSENLKQQTDQGIQISKFKPDSNFSHTTSEYNYPVHINAKELRGKEYSYKKDQNSFRILILGPSWVFGWGVPIEHSVPYLLEQSLQSDFANKKIEVINAGLPAQWLFYNIFYYLLEGYKYNPDAVVVMQVHDFGFMGISDLMKLKKEIVPLNVEAVYQNMYRKIAGTPLLRKSELLYFILEQTRRNEDIRKYIHITYVANPKKQASALDEKKFFKRFSQAPEAFGGVLSSLVEFSQYIEGLEPDDVQKYVFAGGDPTWNAVPDYDIKDNGGIIPQASDAITKVLSEFFTVLEGTGKKTLLFNVNGHAFFEGRRAEKDAYISAQTTASLKKFNINYLSYDAYLFDTMNYSYGDPEIKSLFYPLDKHPNQQGYELLAKLLHEKIVDLQWVP